MTTQPPSESMLDHCFFATCRELEHLEALLGNGALRAANEQVHKIEAALGHYLRVAVGPGAGADHTANALFASLMVRLRQAITQHPELHAGPACADLREQLADDRRARAPLHLESSPLPELVAEKRASPPTAPVAPVHPSLTEPHRQLERVLADVEFLVARRSFAPAAARFGELRLSLERHMNEEENDIFPRYVKRVGDPDGLIASARAGHTRLRGLLDTLSAAISESDYAQFSAHVGELDRTLSAHSAEEENALHRELARVLPEFRPPEGLRPTA